MENLTLQGNRLARRDDSRDSLDPSQTSISHTRRGEDTSTNEDEPCTPSSVEVKSPLRGSRSGKRKKERSRSVKSSPRFDDPLTKSESSNSVISKRQSSRHKWVAADSRDGITHSSQSDNPRDRHLDERKSSRELTEDHKTSRELERNSSLVRRLSSNGMARISTSQTNLLNSIRSSPRTLNHKSKRRKSHESVRDVVLETLQSRSTTTNSATALGEQESCSPEEHPLSSSAPLKNVIVSGSKSLESKAEPLPLDDMERLDEVVSIEKVQKGPRVGLSTVQQEGMAKHPHLVAGFGRTNSSAMGVQRGLSQEPQEKPLWGALPFKNDYEYDNTSDVSSEGEAEDEQNEADEKEKEEEKEIGEGKENENEKETKKEKEMEPGPRQRKGTFYQVRNHNSFLGEEKTAGDAESSSQKLKVSASTSWTMGKRREETTLFVQRPEYVVELCSNKVSLNTMSIFLIDQDRYTPYYRHYFYEKDHVNYLVYDENKDPVFISVEKRKPVAEGEVETSVPLRAFVRTCNPWTSDSEADMWMMVPRSRSMKRAVAKALEDLVGPKPKMYELQDSSQKLFLKLEDQLLMKEFMEFLGEVINLQGWEGYRGGLDVKTGTTGEKSVFTRISDYDIMFHVGPLLPHTLGDEQQLAKKRHIGNDIVVIIFKDTQATEPLDPSIFVSEFNHVFAIVQKVSAEDLRALKRSGEVESEARTHYRIAFASKDGVHSLEPPIPRTVFEKNSKLHRLFLTKVLNSERSAMYADKFVTKMARTRLMLMQDYGKDLVKLEKREKTAWQKLKK